MPVAGPRWGFPSVPFHRRRKSTKFIKFWNAWAVWHFSYLVIGSLCLRKVISTFKYTILMWDHRFFAAVLSQIDLGKVDTKEADVFVWFTMNCVIKSTEKPFTLRKVYCEHLLFKCVQPVSVILNVFDTHITRAGNKHQRREVVISGNGSCYSKADVALWRDETSDERSVGRVPLCFRKIQRFFSCHSLLFSTWNDERMSLKRIGTHGLDNLRCSHSISNHKVLPRRA